MSKRFHLEPFSPSSHKEIRFEKIWHSIQPKSYSSALPQYLKEVEARILREAKEKANLIEKEAYEKGFAQGERDGLEMGQKRIEAILHQFKNILLEIDQQRETLYHFYEKEMLQLVVSLSKKIIHHETSVNPEIILKTLQEAIQYLVDQKKVVIHLNPVDYQYLLTRSETSPLALGDQERVRVIEDPSITRGGCLLETPYGRIDATLESQFDEIVSLIWEERESSLTQSKNP